MSAHDGGTVATGGEATFAGIRELAEPGDVVAGYRIEALAGHGGMGVVYRAREPELGRSVALKLIAPERARDPGFRELFVRESLAAASLEHPNVIPIYRAGDDDGRLFIAMRYVEGSTLRDEIARARRLPPGRATRLVAQVAAALDAAHARGLVHRDVKPANVLLAAVGDEEHVYLSDFGVSLATTGDGDGGDGDGTGDLAPGRFAGTLSYLAPEQIRGEPVDARTDVYALGCVLFESLTGTVPFSGDDRGAVLAAHLTMPPPRVSELVHDVPPGFDEVVATALAKRPDDRYPSAGALARAALALRYDALVLHHADDGPAARELATGLVRAGLETRVVRADSADVREDLRASNACALLIGERGLGPWAREALSAAADLAAADRSFRAVAALLPGAPERTDPELAFLASWPFADLSAGVGDPEAAPRLARTLRSAPPPPAAAAEDRECPYRGLDAFDEEHAEYFVGREQDVARLVERLEDGRFLAVVGPSGFGKSSLVRAGVVPALRAGALPGSDRWPVAVMSPGSRPLASLAATLHTLLPAAPRLDPDQLGASAGVLDTAVSDALAGRPDDARAVLVVDQFEEVFTLCADPAERTAFLDALCRAATIPGGRLIVLPAMRADFYPRCAEHPRLRALVSDRQYLVGPLGPAELRRVIEEPARRAGLELEPGLARTVLEDVADRPGALPLLEHLLMELWSRREGRTLTLDAYAASGGVEGALAKRADAEYAALDAEGQAAARRVLLRLVQPGEGTEDTRRVAQMRELVGEPGERAAVEGVVASLSAARLLTTGSDPATGEPTVEIAHEALIRGWPALRGWINDDRETLRLHRRLTDASAEWERSGRDDGGLYRGARLAAWQERSQEGLNPLEREFLDASRARADRERGAARRRVRIAIGALVAGLAIVAVLAILALISRQDATDQRDLAQSRELATESQTQLATDPELATLLASSAYDTSPSAEAEAALRQAVHDSHIRGALHMPGELPLAVAASPNGQAAVGTDGGVFRLWDPAKDPRGTSATKQGTWPGGINTIARSDDGFLTGGNDGAVVAWPPAGGRAAPHVVAKMDGSVYSVRLSPDGKRILATGDKAVIAHDLATGRTRTLARGSFFEVAFDTVPGGFFTTDPEGKLLRWAPGATQGEPVTIPGSAQVMGASPDGRLLGVGTGQGLVVLRLGPEPRIVFSDSFEGGVNSVAFGPGGLIAAAGGDGSVRVVDASGQVLARMTGHQGPVAGVTFLGRDRVVSVGVNGSARAWAWEDGREPRLPSGALPGSGGVAFLPQGRVAVVAADGSARAWTPPAAAAPELLPADTDGMFAAAVSPDGRLIATAPPDGRLVVRDVTGRRIGSWQLGAVGGTLAWTPDGRTVAAALLGGKVVTVKVDSPAAPRVLGTHAEDATAVASRPSDGTIASGGRDGVIRLWDGTRGGRLIDDLDAQINSLAFTADGRRLAAAVGDETVRIYDVGGTDQPTVLRGRFGSSKSVAFSSDGATLVTGSDNGLRLWDWRRGVILLTVPRDSGVAFVAATGTAPRVASYGSDNVVRITTCDVCGPIDGVRDLARQRTTRELTAGERTDFKTNG